MILIFLNSLGFQVFGKAYLCFRLKDKKSIDIGASKSFLPSYNRIIHKGKTRWDRTQLAFCILNGLVEKVVRISTYK